jgi:hypothetical protein
LLEREVHKLRSQYAQDIKQVEIKYETAMNEFKEFQIQKAEFEQKGRRKAETLTEIKESQINTASQNDQYTSAKPSTYAKRKSHQDGSISGGDSEFSRAEEDENILNEHMNPVHREKVQNLLEQVKQFDDENKNDDYESEEFDRESADAPSSIDYRYPKVKPVTKEEIIPQVKKIMKYCKENEIEIIEVQSAIFDDFQLAKKVSISNLTKLLLKRFGLQFDHEEALLLARFMVEQPEMFKSDQDEDEEIEYRFDPDKELSQVKVISKLQQVMSSLY